MPDVLSDAGQLTPAGSRRRFARGVLGSGRVTGIQHQSFVSKYASVAQIDARYSAGATPSAPRRLFLKLGRRRIEVEFFNHGG
jgi:hypothetical protein